MSKGSDTICLICGDYVEHHQMQVQLSFDQEGLERFLHIPCYRAWELERSQGEGSTA